MILENLEATAAQFHAWTGWEIKPEGACKGDICVPLGESAFDLRATADRLGMALVHDAHKGVWALGPESLGDRALLSAVTPDFTLPAYDGSQFRLSSLRGQKVVLVAWAPY